MPSVTITPENMEKEGPVLEVQFFISSELEKNIKKKINLSQNLSSLKP